MFLMSLFAPYNHFQPADANALVLMALVEQVTATKDRNKRQLCHTNALEYRFVDVGYRSLL